MSYTEVILLQRVENLGQMGEVVKVRPGYARNFLLPQGKALRANAVNKARFDSERAQLEAENIRKKEEAERLAERLEGLSVVILRQAGDSGSLYGSVTSRDIAVAVTERGAYVGRDQIILPHPVKSLGVVEVSLVLHPEVSLAVKVNVARSQEEAERQARGEAAQSVERKENVLEDLHAQQALEETEEAGEA